MKQRIPPLTGVSARLRAEFRRLPKSTQRRIIADWNREWRRILKIVSTK